MDYYKIGDSNIPALGLGTYLINGNDATQIVESAIDIGYRHIDTAQLYENESEVGAAIKQSPVDRSEIFLTTKVWPTRLSKEDFMPSFEDSLRKLKTDYVDLLLIHWPNAEVPLRETIPELIKAQEQGKAKHIGVSNFPIALLARSMGLDAKLICNQVEYHPYINQSNLKGWMDHNDILLTAYCPLAQGRVFKDNHLIDIANELGKSVAQVVLRWLIQQKNVMAIPKSSNLKRLQENLEIFNFTLSDEIVEQINKLSDPTQRFVRPGNEPDWD